MKTSLLLGASLGLLSKAAAANTPVAKLFTANLSSRVPRTLDLVGRTVLPAAHADLVDQLKGNSSQAFHLVVPSLPGFGFSSPAPEGWEMSDTATLLNTLMTQVLGYKTYAVHGTDWGGGVAFDMYDQFNTTVKAIHLGVFALLFADWWPRWASLVYYSTVEFGGHFPGVDSPAALADDIRLVGKYFKA